MIEKKQQNYTGLLTIKNPIVINTRYMKFHNAKSYKIDNSINPHSKSLLFLRKI